MGMNRNRLPDFMNWGVPEWRNAGFTSVPLPFLKSYALAGLSSNEAMLVIHLASFKWSDRSKIHPSLKTLADRMNLSRQQVRYLIHGRPNRSKKGLMDKGLVVKERTGSTNIYRLSGVTQRCHELSKNTHRNNT